MARVSITLQLKPEQKAALEKLTKMEGRALDKLLSEAIMMYLSRRSPGEYNVAKLRVYRKRDPQFKKAIAAFIEAEASLEDPVEGEQLAGPIQRRIRRILRS